MFAYYIYLIQTNVRFRIKQEEFIMKNLNTNALENLKLDLENHVLIVTMNRPKALNALNNQTLDELQMVFDYVSKENDIYGVIITGEGRGFVAGADIVQMQPYRSEQDRDCLV